MLGLVIWNEVSTVEYPELDSLRLPEITNDEFIHAYRSAGTYDFFEFMTDKVCHAESPLR